MALKGTFQIDDNNDIYTLVECEYRLSQSVSADGLPQAGVTGGLIIATIVTPTKGYALYEWMVNDFMKKDGKLSFITNVNGRTLPATRCIRFEEAFCTDLYEYFNGQDSSMMTTRLSIQARKILFADHTGQGIGIDNYTKKVAEGEVKNDDILKAKLKSMGEAKAARGMGMLGNASGMGRLGGLGGF